MTADLHRRATDLDRVIRRRASDAKRVLPVEEEAAVQRRIAADRLDWASLDRNMRMTPIDNPQRRVDVEALLRERDAGEIDIVQLTDAEAVALGLQKPSIAMRMRSLWTRFNRWAR